MEMDMTGVKLAKAPVVVVGVLLYNDAGQVLLGRGPRFQNKWVIVGGHVEYGESLYECAVREVLEETGLAIERIEHLDIQESIASDEFVDSEHFVFINYSAKIISGKLRPNEEFDELRWLEKEEALSLNLNTSTRQLVTRFFANTRK
jgi:nucleoside triphosphatase